MGKGKSKKRRKSAEDSSSSSSESSREKKKIRKLKKKLKKEQKKTEKALKKKLREQKKRLKKNRKSVDKEETTPSSDIPIELMERSKAMAPMTKEEWEQRQSVIRKVLDEETGRYRLIKGDGEVLEEIVSKDRHRQINKQATMADGEFFQTQTNKQFNKLK